MSRKSFEELCQLIGPSIVKQNTRFRNVVPVEKKITCTMYYLSDEGRVRKIANAFSLRKSTVSKVIREVCKSISINLKCLIKLPNTITEVKDMVSKFYLVHGFPQWLGAVDGSHIIIKKSKTNANDYMNRKGHSFNVQAASDYQYVFWRGNKMTWERTRRKNFFWFWVKWKLRNEYIPSCSKIIVEGEDPVPVCILGDPTYSLLPFLMKKFVNGGSN